MAKMEQGNKKSTLIDGCKHVYSLCGKYTPKDKLCKYLPFNRLKNSINVKDSKIELSFVKPKCWMDPFEHIYADREYPGFLKPDVACLCVVEDEATTSGAEAMWNAYPATGDKLVRVAFNSEKLLSRLDSYAEQLEYDLKFYIAEMDYSMSRKALKGKNSLTDSKSPMDLDKYLSLMCFKRKAFEYEHEIRIFAVTDTITGNILKVSMPCDNALIKKVTIAPIRPFAYDDPRKKEYKTLCKSENRAYVEALRELLPDTKICRSTIYELKDKIETYCKTATST